MKMGTKLKEPWDERLCRICIDRELEIKYVEMGSYVKYDSLVIKTKKGINVHKGMKQ
jgi:hypothetical protein